MTTAVLRRSLDRSILGRAQTATAIALERRCRLVVELVHDLAALPLGLRAALRELGWDRATLVFRALGRVENGVRCAATLGCCHRSSSFGGRGQGVHAPLARFVDV